MDYFWRVEYKGEKFLAHTADRLGERGRPIGHRGMWAEIKRGCPGIEALRFLGAAHPADSDALHEAAQAGRIGDAATFRAERDRIATERQEAARQTADQIAAFRQEAARIDAWIAAG